MISVKQIVTGLSIALLVLAGSVVLLFNWSATGWKGLSVPTSSMHPAIPQNSLVLVHRVPVKSLKIGDVMTYINPFNPSQTISHRIVKTYTIAGKIPAFVTKGDANKVADVPVTEGSVVGKVVWHVPHIGAWLLWSKKPIALLPLIWIPALFIMAEEVQRLNEYFKLSQPYRLFGYSVRRRIKATHHRLAMAGSFAAMFVLLGALFWEPALALLKSNTVTLANNQLSVAAKPTNQCSGNTHSTTNINVNNSSSQTSTSGNSSSSGNTSGGSASSGSASNSNFSSTTVTVTNSC